MARVLAQRRGGQAAAAKACRLAEAVVGPTTTAPRLDQILVAVPGVPIAMFWDRAPWHAGPPIRGALEANPRLHVILYPVAAPDLDPQEHVWKATREVISHNHTMPNSPGLADRFEQHLTTNTFSSSLPNRATQSVAV